MWRKMSDITDNAIFDILAVVRTYVNGSALVQKKEVDAGVYVTRVNSFYPSTDTSGLFTQLTTPDKTLGVITHVTSISDLRQSLALFTQITFKILRPTYFEQFWMREFIDLGLNIGILHRGLGAHLGRRG